MKKLMFIGNLTADPETRSVNVNGEATDVCNFTVAVNKGKDEAADFYRVAAWRGLAEICSTYLSKGNKVYVESDIFEPRLYTKNDGGAGISFDVTAAKVEFLTPRSNNSETTQAPKQPPRQPGRQAPKQPNKRQANEYESYNGYDDGYDDDLPF